MNHHFSRPAWWRGLPEAVRVAALAAASAVAILALLIAFVSELPDAGQQGGMPREATAALASLTWRCKAVADAQARQDCQLHLLPAPSRAPMPLVQTARASGS